MRSYYVISKDEYLINMLNDNYPVVQEITGFVVVVCYDDQEPPSGDWQVFEGDESNKRCSEFLKESSSLDD